jgi:long-chain acyl-CoA synthetase
MGRTFRGPELDVPDVTLAEWLFQTAEDHPDEIAMKTRRGPDGGREAYTWSEVAGRVLRIADGLADLGFEAGDRAGILSQTRYEWVGADLAALSLGGVTVTYYTTLEPDQLALLLDDADPSVLFVSGPETYATVVEADPDGLRAIVTFDPIANAEEDLAKETLTLRELEERGAGSEAAPPLQERLEAIHPTDTATVIYTSGTTGRPKGCVLTHRNFVSAVESVSQVLEDCGPDDVGLAYLPLAHSYQRQSAFWAIKHGITNVFTTPSDLGDDLEAVQPTVYAGVPRIFERMYEEIVETVDEEGRLKKTLFERASDVAREYGAALDDGGEPGALLKLRHGFYDRLVFSTLREKIGAERLRYVTTGAAAIRPDLLHWFRGVGVPILEGYGLTETSAPSNLNLPERFQSGTVGPPIPGVVQRIDDETGEVLTKGPNVFEGYLNLPDETDEAFDDDGWFRTGDIGEFDEDGYLEVVDRLKQLEIMSTGKNLAPVPVEESLKSHDLVSEALVVAEDRKYATALIQPAFGSLVDRARKGGVDFDQDAVETRVNRADEEEIVSVPDDLLEADQVQEWFREAVDQGNEGFADWEKVSEFRLVSEAWTVDSGELTPTLKKKRRVIEERFGGLIEGMY